MEQKKQGCSGCSPDRTDLVCINHLLLSSAAKTESNALQEEVALSSALLAAQRLNFPK